MPDRHPDEDLLLDLALSDIDDQQGDTLTGHLAMCEPCRARYTAITDSVDHVLAAAPRVGPPPGFSKSTLAAMGIDDDPTTSHRAARDDGPARRGQPLDHGEPSPNRRPRWTRPQVWLASVAAVLALLVGAAGTAVVLNRSPESPAAVTALGPALVTGEGASVGTVLDSWYDGRKVLIVTLTQGRVGARYDCQLILADGTRQSGGSWVLDSQAGATWVIAHPGTDITRLELVTDSGSTWATAAL